MSALKVHLLHSLGSILANKFNKCRAMTRMELGSWRPRYHNMISRHQWTYLSLDEGLEAWLEVLDASIKEAGHAFHEILVHLLILLLGSLECLLALTVTSYTWAWKSYIQIVPQKMIIRLSANCELIWICFRIIKSVSQRKPHPLWFSSHEEISIFIWHVVSPFHPNFDRKETHTTQWTLNSTLILNGLCRCIYKNWMEGNYDISNKNPHFFVTTELNRMGFLPKCR